MPRGTRKQLDSALRTTKTLHDHGLHVGTGRDALVAKSAQRCVEYTNTGVFNKSRVVIHEYCCEVGSNLSWVAKTRGHAIE